MKRALLWILGSALIGLIVAAFWAFSFAKRQGLSDEELAVYDGAQVERDSRGIPTVNADDWLKVIRAEGFVVASERLWQMDLIRRKAGGRLAEWFGAAAFEHDARKQAEDRIALAYRSADSMPAEERAVCDAYALGVSDFIERFPDRWGVEYALLRVKPEPWRCGDSLLVLLEMSETLTGLADQEAQQYVWRRNLSEPWQTLIFPQSHAWNHPLVRRGPLAGGGPLDGVADGGPRLPPVIEHLPQRPIQEKEASGRFEDANAIGSNNWAWSGPTGAFLANDPHLGYGVPMVWYALRLRVAADNWVVGATIPGLPGVVIGMNPFVSWAFTNTGEDVDDLLLEKLSPDGGMYLVSRDSGAEKWEPVESRTFKIMVRGEATPREVVGRFTRRGPMSQRRYLGDGWYSRQWLPLKEDVLRLPTARMARVRTLEELDDALDGMRTPAQNVVAMDGAGNFLYRTSGTGVRRRSVHSGSPQPAVEGEWTGFEPPSERPRRRWNVQDGAKTQFLGTANQRIWIDDYDNQWYSDDRVERIERFLATRDDFQVDDMRTLQLDTESRYRQLLLNWVAEHAGAVDGKAGHLTTGWRSWDGTSRADPAVFAQSGFVDREISRLLVGRLQARFAEADRDVPYLSWNRHAWMLELIAPSHEYGFDPFAIFGLTSSEVAQWVLGRLVDELPTLSPQQLANRWDAQHPLTNRIPLLGRVFAVDQPPQWGASDLVRAEQPAFGPSMRLVWSMTRPAESTWSFPVGQSGHISSKHYRDYRSDWEGGAAWPVFANANEWQFPGR